MASELTVWHHKKLSCWNMRYSMINSMLTLRDIYLYNVDIVLGWAYIMHLYDSSSGLSTMMTGNRGVSSSGSRATQCNGTLDVPKTLHRKAIHWLTIMRKSANRVDSSDFIIIKTPIRKSSPLYFIKYKPWGNCSYGTFMSVLIYNWPTGLPTLKSQTSNFKIQTSDKLVNILSLIS